MATKELLHNKRNQILALANRYGVQNIRIFGSTARGEARPDSDIDFLVEVAPDLTLLNFIAFKQDLEDLLGCPVDVVTEPELHPRIRQHIIEEAVAL